MRPFFSLLCDLLSLPLQSRHARQGRGRVLRTALVWVALLLSTYQGSINDKSIFSTSSTRSVSLFCLQKHTSAVRRVIFARPPRRITNDPSLLVRVAGDHARYPKQVNTSVYVDCVSRDLHRQVCLPNLPRAQSKYNLPFSLDTLHTHDRPQILENENWRTRWTIKAQRIQVTETSVASTSALSSHPPSSRGPGSANDPCLLALKQIEEDCEQHNNVENGGGFKRNSGPISWSLLASLASPAPIHSPRFSR